MGVSPETSAPYHVVFSGVARAELRRFGANAVAVGRGDEFVSALRELTRLLRVYPQFGEPSVDLLHDVGQIFRGTVPPLVVRYAVFEERRLVIVAEKTQLLPNSGLEDVADGRS